MRPLIGCGSRCNDVLILLYATSSDSNEEENHLNTMSMPDSELEEDVFVL
jgi:hypothetical protein